ncbi:MAG TPA: T9SS type A sorting domain-containing protein, partial [Chitinophagaceae bacterium]|nr:T9SS type A sorting domain-containing protein [Chitinophagaceae bacterium]
IACGYACMCKPAATKNNLSSSLSDGSQKTPAPVSGLNINTDKPAVNIRLRCQGAFHPQAEPLLLVDGEVTPMDSLEKINPSTIESIEILKDAAGTAIYGCRSANGVILITTKHRNLTICVKDADDETLIIGATIKFISTDSLKRTHVKSANGYGFANFKLQQQEYALEISSVGYNSGNFKWKVEKDGQSLTYYLRKKYIEPVAVVVRGYGSVHRREILSCGSSRLRKLTPLQDYPKDNIVTASIFPNPLTRGQVATINIHSTKDESMQVRVLTFTGQQLFSFPAMIKEGINRLTLPAKNNLPGGMYMVQVLDHKGKPIQTDKLIIQ